MKENLISLTPDFLNLLLNAEPTEEDTQPPEYKYQDPFDKVLLTKGMDNQILTSFRTLTKANNTVSDTLKVVHQKFMAGPKMPQNGKVRLIREKHQLYEVGEDVSEEEEDD